MNYRKLLIESITVAILGSSSFLNAAVEERNYVVDSFSSINLSKGIVSHIYCSSSPSVVASGESTVLDAMTIDVVNGKLKIVNEKSDGTDWGSLASKVVLTIYTDQAINELDTKYGVKTVMEECAVASEALSIKGIAGTDTTVLGSTNSLTLNLSAGSVFNDGYNDFVMDTVNVNMSAGSTATVCQANKISGNLSLGAVAYIGAGTVDTTLKFLGGATIRTAC